MNLLSPLDNDDKPGRFLKSAEDIIHWRERFFNMDGKIELTHEQRNEVWPLVDNFFVRNGGSGDTSGPALRGSHYMNCRFGRKQGKPQGTGARQRAIRPVSEPCGIKIKMTWFYSEAPAAAAADDDVKTESPHVITHWTWERLAKCSPTHGPDCSIDAIDAHKLNSMIRRTAGEAALSGLSASDVVKIMRSKHLQAAGGKTMTISTVHNNARIWKPEGVKKGHGGLKKGERKKDRSRVKPPSDQTATETPATTTTTTTAAAAAAQS